ncbi:S-layer homology domain-containing protein [Hydrogenibacillus schlegelii]|uniref:S-layer homology domain-containing protein n=1 Tax=Hydrogenibacillus schlegelii TaxID=1484 RepID=UPI0034A01E50
MKIENAFCCHRRSVGVGCWSLHRGVRTAQAETRFSDVPPGAWYERAVMQARTRGMVDGFPDGRRRTPSTPAIPYQSMP